MRILISWRLFVLVAVALGASLVLPARAAVPAWDMTGTYTICYDYAPPQALCAGGYAHSMTISSMDMVSGEFAGQGSWPAGAVTPTYTWPVEGKVAGSAIYFELGYNELPGHMVWSIGAIDPAGMASGTARDTLGQSLYWSITPGAHFAPWDGGLRSMGYYKQERNKVTGTVVAYVSSCVTKDVESAGAGPAPPATTFAVIASQEYKVTSVGTYFANDGIYADAKYSSRYGGPWQDSVQNYEYLGPELLDLRVDWTDATYGSGSSPAWGMYNPMHSYTVVYAAGNLQTVLSMGLNDINVNNTGALGVAVCGPTGTVDVDAAAVWTAFGAYSASPWNKFQAQFGVTVFNLSADPALGLAVFFKPGNAFSGKTVSELVLIGDGYTSSTPAAALLALKDVFDWINNRMYLYY